MSADKEEIKRKMFTLGEAFSELGNLLIILGVISSYFTLYVSK